MGTSMIVEKKLIRESNAKRGERQNKCGYSSA
jgi:hypothetical protein